MSQKIKHIIFSLALLAGFGASFAIIPEVAAVEVFPTGSCDRESRVCASKGETIQPILQTVINVLLFLVGAISVIMIIVSGIMYASSAGDTSTVTKAKNALLYAVVGLIVAFAAFAIVNWVIDWV